MSSGSIQHALCLHLYQPAGNLRALLQQDEGETARILKCYERVARHAHKYAQVARMHVALSVVLLEQLRDPELIDACRHLADLPAILDGLRSAASIEFLGTGYRHAPLPLIPPDDWDEQLRNERVTVEVALGRVLKGYWPPASLFTPAMIPALVRAGYEYVLLPSPLLAMRDGSAVDPYRPYRMSHGGARIVVVPLDRGFSQAQETGLDAPWFADEVRNGVAFSPAGNAPYLLGTWSDGENGEWFRRLDEEHGFFGAFFSPYMEFCETGEFPVRPVRLSDYLAVHRPATEVVLRAPPETEPVAAVAEGRRLVRERLARSSARYWSLARSTVPPAHARTALPKARELILDAEDSGLLLGDTGRQAALLALLDEADRLMDPRPVPAAAPAASPPPSPAPALSPAPAVPTPVPTGLRAGQPAAGVTPAPKDAVPAAPAGAVAAEPRGTAGAPPDEAAPAAPDRTPPAAPDKAATASPARPPAKPAKGRAGRSGRRKPSKRRS
jgi:4-alpha-glucanotransferase